MKFNLLFSLFLKFFSMIVSFVSIPLYINYFNNDDVLGLWFAILAILNWIMYFDLGIGNGLKNELIRLISKKDFLGAKIVYIKALKFIVLISLVFIVISFLTLSSLYFLNTQNLYGISKEKFYLSIILLLVAVAIHLPLKLSIAGLLSFQKSAISNLPIFITPMLVMFFLMFYEDLEVGGEFLILSVVYCFALILPLIATLAYFFSALNKKIINTKSTKLTSSSFRDEVIKPGLSFFYIQILLLLVVGTNEILILNLLSGEQVVDYQVYYRLYSIGLVFFTTFCIPLWGYLRKAFLENNIDETFTYTKYLILSFFLTLLIIMSFFVFDTLIFKLWIDEDSFNYNQSDSLYMSIYIATLVMVNLTAVFTNSFGKLRYQAIGLLIAFILKLLLCFVLDLSGWAEIVLITSFCLVPCLFFQGYCLDKKINLRKYYVR